RTVLRPTGGVSGLKGNVQHVAFDPGGKWLAACVDSSMRHVWDLAKLSEPRLVQPRQGLWQGELASSPDGQLLACVSTKGVKLYRTADWKALPDLPDNPDKVIAV